VKAIRVDRPGDPEQLELVDVPIPDVGDGELLIEVEYAGVMYADVAQRRDTYLAPHSFPWYPGREVAGVVERVGPGVDDVEQGDRVVAMVLTGGGYAEYVIATTHEQTFPTGIRASAADVLKLPAHVSGSQALVYVTNFRFAHVMLHAHAAVPSGASVLVHGASGGFGSCLTQVARANDNLVLALCRSAEEAAYCVSLGADHTFDTTTGDYVEWVLDVTRGEGVECSFNGVGGPTLDRDPSAVRRRGEIHAYGYVAGKSAFHPFDVRKSLALKTFAADDFLATSDFQRATEAMYEAFERGPLMDVTALFDLADAARAHRSIEDGRAIGKIALTP
jgi:NADPH2:quinone reductase